MGEGLVGRGTQSARVSVTSMRRVAGGVSFRVRRKFSAGYESVLYRIVGQFGDDLLWPLVGQVPVDELLDREAAGQAGASSC